MNIYACSDIHGQYGLFQKMLKDIRFSDDDLLYIVGDVYDFLDVSLHVSSLSGLSPLDCRSELFLDSG